MLYRCSLPMDQLRRLKPSSAVHHRSVRRTRLESANMLVPLHRLRLLPVWQNSVAWRNNAQTICAALIGCRKSRSLFGNSSRPPLPVKGTNISLLENKNTKYSLLICPEWIIHWVNWMVLRISLLLWHVQAKQEFSQIWKLYMLESLH